MIFGLIAARFLLGAPVLVSGLQLLPPVRQDADFSAAAVWRIESSPRTIYIEKGFASQSDTDGLTLIPPTGHDYAALFQQDISRIPNANWTLQLVDRLPEPANASGILLGAYKDSSVTYEDGASTSEGYELVVAPTSVLVRGTGTRGLWWGTRTLLQSLLIKNGTLPVGRSVDAPAYRTRGFMLDAGRKWYSPAFLKELCSYASFFKMNEFHYHLSDNYPLNRGHNDSWRDIYSHFSLLPEDPDLRGIIARGRENETLTRSDFADLQKHCAARGVAVIPEIEAPGHCLYLTKWKPELALPEQQDLLNLSHPETIPTVKRIWAEFLPWFEVKEVHVGADEYNSTLADDYIAFVNDMSSFVNSTSGKRIRIWGTDEPSKNVNISKDIVIQHWQYGQSEPTELVDNGYDVINSEDWWAYMSLKNDHMPILPAPYPQFFNETRILNFADEPGRQWTPADFNPVNKTEQVSSSSPHNRGAILAAWNDNGPDATTQLEAYYAMRRGIPLIAARSWSGSRGPKLSDEDVAPSVDFFSPRAPGQNLDRVIAPSSSTRSSSGPGRLVSWSRPESKADTETIHLGLGSKGMNFTLTLSVEGPFTLSGPDDTLSLHEDRSLVFTSDGWDYPLRSVAERDALELDPGHPGRIWVNASESTHKPVAVSTPANITITTDPLHGSVAWIDGQFAGRFEVFVFGGRNTQFSWSQMAFVAPLHDVSSSGLRALGVEDGVRVPPKSGGGSGTTSSGSRVVPPAFCLAGLPVAAALGLI